MRHVQMTRLVWLVAGLLVVACVLFAMAHGGIEILDRVERSR